MSRQRTYLDHNATAPLRPEARAAMVEALDVVGNASSVHAEGRSARGLIERAREQVAALVGAEPREVVFTSGASEANNWVVRGGAWSGIGRAAIEHESVLAPVAASGARIVELSCGDDGVIDPAALEAMPDAADGGYWLVTVQAANSETGVLQPVAEAAARARARGAVLHTDAVQAAGRVPLEFARSGVDLMSVSAHKLGGPKGVGALIIRDGVELPGFILGGGQERRLRAGTENVAGIAGFGAAASVALDELADMARVRDLRDRLEAGVREMTPAATVIGASTLRLPNTSCIAVPGADAMSLVIRLDLAGIAIGAGSACSSGKVGVSHVLRAMGIEESHARAAIRVSLGTSSSAEDVDVFLGAWREIHARQRISRSRGVMAAASQQPIREIGVGD
ncbi:MAG: cysteine desulfurase family protein [Dehalococcoidia bacterium]